MGWFTTTPFEEIRLKLRREWIAAFRMGGWPADEAERLTQGLLEIAEKRSRENGTDRYPPNFGNIILQQYETDQRTRDFVDSLRAEGVRDEDIRWWWNMHDIERCMVLADDEVSRLRAFKREIAGGSSEDAATEAVRRRFPLFGTGEVPADRSDNRSLPFELKDRINRYLEVPRHRDDLIANAMKFPSMNAYIRSRIRTGAL